MTRSSTNCAGSGRNPRSGEDGQGREAPAEVRQIARSLVTGHFRPLDLATPATTPERPDDHPADAAEAPSDTVAVLPGRADLSGSRADRPGYAVSVARVGVQVADALAYAHARHIIHRDVKPSNLLLDGSGVVWVADFGLAKTDDEALTHTGDLVGTLRYMAPERFQGECDARADVYSLGLTLYEMLTLRPAFAAPDRVLLMEQVQSKSPPRPRSLDPRVPRDLETIVLKAIDKDPGRRYPSADEMADDLRRFLADVPVRARRSGLPERLWRWARRNRVVASLTAAVLLLVLMVAVGSTVAAVWLGRALHDTEAANTGANARLWESLLAQARASRMTRQPGHRFNTLRAIEEAMKLPLPEGRSLDELRTEAIAALCLADLELAREWDGWPIGSSGFAIDDAFQRYARGDKDGNVSVRRLADDEELFRLRGTGILHGYDGLQFSPDGRYLHQQVGDVKAGSRSRLWKLGGLQPALVLEGDHWGVAFRPDSQVLAAANVDGSIRLYDTATGHELRRWRGGTDQRVGLCWHPTLPRLAVVTWAAWRVVDVETQKVLLEHPSTRSESFPTIAWHPDGRLLALTGDDAITVWDTQTDRPAHLLRGHKPTGVVARFNRAGDWLVSNDWSGVLRVWDVRAGRQMLSLPAAWGPLYFSPDDRVLGHFLASGKVQLFRCRSGRELRTMIQPDQPGGKQSGYEYWAAPSTGGRLMAVNSSPGVALVDVARAEEVALLPPDGNLLLRIESADQAVWTYGGGRLWRWPIRAASARGHTHHLGPPEVLGPMRTGWLVVGSSPDCNLLAIPNYSLGALLWNRQTNRTFTLGPQDDVERCAFSPDGRWVVTASHNLFRGAGAKVWAADTGRHVADLPVSGMCWVTFSPDGKWLVTNTYGFRIWEVGTWKEGPALGGPAHHGLSSFSSDGKLLALGGAAGTVQLVVPETGKEIALLTGPEETRLVPQCFTPDGGQLITGGHETHALYIFDLRAIREQLKDLGLDWDAPPLKPAPAVAKEPLRVHVDPGTLQRMQADQLVQQANQHLQARKHAEALEALRRAVQIDPTYPQAHDGLARQLLFGPKPLRDPKQALTHARRAVELAPQDAAARYPLGVALYNNGRWAEAVPHLEKALKEAQHVPGAFPLFYLAMCHHRLGDAAKAKDCRDRAARQFQEQRAGLPPAHVERLTELQAEADAVFEQPPGKPAEK